MGWARNRTLNKILAVMILAWIGVWAGFAGARDMARHPEYEAEFRRTNPVVWEVSGTLGGAVGAIVGRPLLLLVIAACCYPLWDKEEAAGAQAGPAGAQQ